MPPCRGPAHRPPPGPVALRFLPLLSLLLAIWGCAGSWSIGARSLPITHRPASALRLVIQITGQYSDLPNVVVLIHVFAGPSPNDEVALAEGAHLTCNGQNIKAGSPVEQLLGQPCPRQPPGGAYRITYTDEHGLATTAVVPVPAGMFAILSPPVGATVPIPTQGVLEVHYATPIPPPGGTVAIGSVIASCGTGLNVCGAVSARLQGSGTPTVSTNGERADPTGSAAREPLASTGSGRAAMVTPQPGATPTPSAESSSATATQGGSMGTIRLRGDYSRFQPGPGTIGLEVEAHVPPDPGGFAAATATFVSETLLVAITWTR